MIKLFFEGGLGNQLFQYTFGRYLQIMWNEDVKYDISKYKFNSGEIRDFELKGFNICKDWTICVEENNSLKKYGVRYPVYRMLTLPYLAINRYRLKHNLPTLFDKEFQKAINSLGFYRRYYGKYHEITKSYSKNKYIIGHWFRTDIVKYMEPIVRKELCVINPISEENQYYLDLIKNSNSVGLHIRRGDYVTLGMIVCDLDYYVNAMNKLQELETDLVFYIFSDDIEWVKKNLKTDYKIVYVDANNSAVEDMRLLYNCNHFIMSNSTFSWWGAFLGNYPDKKVITPMYWGKEKKKSDMILDEWIAIENF